MNNFFKVVCEMDSSFNHPVIKITHNGYHWMCINLYDPEHDIPIIIKELKRFSKEYREAPGRKISDDKAKDFTE